MSEAFFGISPTTATNAIVNIETYMDYPATVKSPSGGGHYLVPLTSGRRREVASGYTREDGRIDAQLVFDVESRADLADFMYAIFGGWTVPSVKRAMSLMDETGYYSAWVGYISKPRFGAYPYNRTEVVFDLKGLTYQSVTKTSNYTVTTSDHVINADTTSGSITLALPAVAGVANNVPFLAIKPSGTNNLVFDPNGAQTFEGASTYTVTAANTYVNYYTDGTQWKLIEVT